MLAIGSTITIFLEHLTDQISKVHLDPSIHIGTHWKVASGPKRSSNSWPGFEVRAQDIKPKKNPGISIFDNYIHFLAEESKAKQNKEQD